MKALNTPSLLLYLLSALQVPKATESWLSPIIRDKTRSFAKHQQSVTHSRPRCLTSQVLRVLFATKNIEAEVSGNNTKGRNKGDGENVFDIRNHRHYDRFETFLGSEIGLTNRTHVKRIAERSPGLLDYTEPRLNETFNFFRGHFGYSNDELQTMIRKESRIFVYSVQSLEANLMKISRHLFDDDMSAVGLILAKRPGIIGLDFENNIIPKVNYLREKVFHYDNEALQGFLLRNPIILMYSLNSRIIPRVEAFREQGLDPSDRIPTWCGLPIKKFEKWFKKNTGVSLPDDWCPPAKARQKGLSFEQRVQERSRLLSTELSLDNEEVRSIMERDVRVKDISMGNFKKKLEYLVGLFSGSKEEAKYVIFMHPVLLMVSLDNILIPKVEYLRNTVFRGIEQDFIATIKMYPELLATVSLEKRVKPRFEASIAAGLNPSDLNIGQMMRMTDKQFAQWLERQQQVSG